MSFGGSKSKQQSSSSSSQTRQNFDLFTPFGDTVTKGKEVTFTPEYLPGQLEGLQNSSLKSSDIVNQINPNFSVEGAFNNPFYQNTRDLLQQPIKKARDVSAKELQNRLSAQNQLGSSFDAYSKQLQNDAFNDRLDQADRQARNFSFDAYQNNLNNQLQVMQALTGNTSQIYNQALLPLQLALGQPAYNVSGASNSVSRGSSSNFGANLQQGIGGGGLIPFLI